MTVELDFRTAGYLWSFWLKEEHRSDCQLTGETLLTILGLLTGPRIENLVTCEALSLLSSSLNRLRSSEIINKCAPLLFGEKRTDNKWFYLPPAGERKQAVNVIYVNGKGRRDRIYYTLLSMALTISPIHCEMLTVKFSSMGQTKTALKK